MATIHNNTLFIIFCYLNHIISYYKFKPKAPNPQLFSTNTLFYPTNPAAAYISQPKNEHGLAKIESYD